MVAVALGVVAVAVPVLAAAIVVVSAVSRLAWVVSGCQPAAAVPESAAGLVSRDLPRESVRSARRALWESRHGLTRRTRGGPLR